MLLQGDRFDKTILDFSSQTQGGLTYDIIPVHAAHSILAYRMNSTEPGTAMPELGRTLIHREGVRLIADWINSMKKK